MNKNSVSLTNKDERLSILLTNGAILRIVASGKLLRISYSPKNFDLRSIDSELGSTPREDIWINLLTPYYLAALAIFLGS